MKDIGIDNFRIGGIFTPMGYSYYNEFKDEAMEIAEETEKLSDNNFNVFNLFNDRLIDTYIQMQDYIFCPMKELCSYIGADYNVYTCCTYSYNDKGYIGSIKNKSFKELWNSAEKEKMFSNHSPKIMCKNPCLYRSKNEFINYCIKKDPKHINFI